MNHIGEIDLPREQRKRIAVVLFLLVLLFFALSTLSDLISHEFTKYPTRKHVESQTYTDHEFIAILGNEDLLSQAASEGWDGTGSSEDPIIISGYRIVDSRHLFRIVNTNLHFIFQNNYLDGINGEWCGLYLANVTNGKVWNNIVMNTAIGFHMLQIYNCSLANNEIYDNYVDGIVLELPCLGNNVTDNHIYDNSECGIILDYGCTNNLIANNEIHDNNGNGIYLWQYYFEPLIANNTIENNLITRQPVGISIQGSSNLISNNTIREAGRNGILCNGINNTIEGNTIEHGNRDGISLYSYARNNTIIFNTIGNNSQAGLEIDVRSSGNYVSRNDFLKNNYSLQVCDDGEDNVFLKNYYSNWNSPDGDTDGYVDYAYPVFGDANNTDEFPTLTPNSNYVPDWYSYEEVTATAVFNPNWDIVIPFILPITGILLLMVVGILLPKRRTGV